MNSKYWAGASAAFHGANSNPASKLGLGLKGGMTVLTAGASDHHCQLVMLFCNEVAKRVGVKR